MPEGKHRFMEPAVAWTFDNLLTGENVPDSGKFVATALCEELRTRANGEPITAEDMSNFLEELVERFETADFLVLRRHAELGGQLSDKGFDKLLYYTSTQSTRDLALRT